MLSEIKPKLTPLINKLSGPFTILPPNLISIVGIIFPVLFLWFMTQQQYIWALIMLAGTAFDLLDGAVARLTNKVSAFGGLLDSTLDRLADALLIIGFYYAGLVSLELVLVVLVESYLISYIRSRAELAAKGNLVLNVGIVERPERLLLLGLALISAFAPLAGITVLNCTLTQTLFIVLAILSFVTVLQRLYISYKKL